ncbi:hypothetical protein ANCCEY_09073 [Ancylostoma ceylanicum]|uniref:Uncharacterized protein n=1 Tax=Ancylostoma ceylanicum TaxID=53326 RepID=A0A0D6LIH5_9BILA|nr:hypothetical protein ANCCEY_09073 [Ancylostoma ceylanicum]
MWTLQSEIELRAMHACRDMSALSQKVNSPPQEIQQYAYTYDDSATEFKWIPCIVNCAHA